MKNVKSIMYAISAAGLLLTTPCFGQTSTSSTTDFICKDTANKMLQSYLNSVNFTENDTVLFSVSLDAEQLRLYLADTSVKRMKIMLAHNLEYINAGNGGKYAGVNRKALTFIIAGYNAAGDYRLHNNSVLNRFRPCPVDCPPGNAASPIIP